MDTFLYFAYGSNMLSKRLRDRTPSAMTVGTGYVEGRKLSFHKVGKDGSGKCDIVATNVKTDRVFGVLYRINLAEKDVLDKAEDLGNGYKEEHITVRQMDGTPARAIVYQAIKISPVIFPYDWYKTIVVAGAQEHRLPNRYIKWIMTFPSQPDPDCKRRRLYEQLLFSDYRN